MLFYVVDSMGCSNSKGYICDIFFSSNKISDRYDIDIILLLRVTFKFYIAFRGVTISHVTLSCSQYLLYFTEC